MEEGLQELRAFEGGRDDADVVDGEQDGQGYGEEGDDGDADGVLDGLGGDGVVGVMSRMAGGTKPEGDDESWDGGVARGSVQSVLFATICAKLGCGVEDGWEAIMDLVLGELRDDALVEGQDE